jgi:hypothetical protein
MKIAISCGYQQLTAANLGTAQILTPVAQAGTGIKPNAALMTVSATAVRFTTDGTTTPTATVGMRLPVGIAPWLYEGPLDKFQAILESGTPTLDIWYCVCIDA